MGGRAPRDAFRLSRRKFLIGLAAIAAGFASSRLIPGRDAGGAGSPTASSANTTVGPGAPTATAPVATSMPGPTPPPSRRPSPVQAENLRRGDAAWNLDGGATPTVQGYFGRASFVPAETLELHLSGSGPVDVEWYRLGWYAGAGGRLIGATRKVACRPQPMPAPDPQVGRIDAGWPVAHREVIGPDWLSGQYVAVLRPASGAAAYVPFVVRPASAAEPGPVLFIHAAATWQAYNGWGGKSLYHASSTGFTTATRDARAAVVSFARPYLEDRGAMYLRRWELQFVRWMERHGRDVEYAADVDLELHPEVAEGRRLIVMAGHPEYWSRPMRQRIERAIQGGTNVAFLTGNEVYWQVRLEDGPTGPGSRIVCYKDATLDPVTLTSPSLATVRWRDAPLNEPESVLVGVLYRGIVGRVGDWVVADGTHWLYDGTHVQRGDRIRNLIGQEFDRYVPATAPPGATLLARSPMQIRGSTVQGIHNATAYVASSGATVIGAGTFQWSWALDDFGSRTYDGVTTPLDARLDRMTRNLFDRLGDGVLRS